MIISDLHGHLDIYIWTYVSWFIVRHTNTHTYTHRVSLCSPWCSPTQRYNHLCPQYWVKRLETSLVGYILFCCCCCCFFVFVMCCFWFITHSISVALDPVQKFSLCRPGWPQTDRDPTASISQVLGFKGRGSNACLLSSFYFLTNLISWWLKQNFPIK